jgi:hypothetical protein
MSEFSWATAALVFVVYVVFDILYALYVIFVGQKRAIAASCTGALLYSLGAVGVMSYTHNLLYLIPLSLGAFVGTYIAVTYMGDKHP